jgi:cell division protein FtsQ
MSGHPPVETPEQRYLRRGANLRVRKVQRLRGILRVVLALAFHGSVAAAIVISLVQAASYLTRTPEFALRRIEVEGVVRSSEGAILRRLEAYRGRNLLDLHLRAIEADVEAEPWVLRASVRRALPDALEVRVTEREPRALALIRGEMYLVDSTGYVIGRTGAGLADDLPVLTGLDEREGRALEAALVLGVGALADLDAAKASFVRDLSELDLTDNDRIVAHLAQGGPRILLDPARVERNLLAYLELRDAIARRVDAPEYVDLRWRDRIAVMPAASTEQGRNR